MTNDECDVLIAVSNQPGRRMMVNKLKRLHGVNWRVVPALIRDRHLIHFEGGWVAVTDAGYEASVLHAAKNF
jgi:hypothetical protein